MEFENKENRLMASFEKVVVNTSNASPIVCRTPLQSVDNVALKRSTKKAYYSQITPTLKTPGRKAARVRPSLLVYQDKVQSDTDDVLLNSLVCKKVDEVIAKAKQQYENQIAEKEKTIANLQNLVKTADDTVNCATPANSIEKNSCNVQTDLVQHSSCGTQVDPVESSNCGVQSDPVENNSCGIQADPVETSSSGTQFDPIESTSCGIQTNPVESNSFDTQTDSVESNNCGTQFDPIESTSCGTQFDPIENASCGTQADGCPCLRCDQMDSDILEEQVSLYVNGIVSKCAADVQLEQITGFINQTTKADRDHQLQSANSLIQQLRIELAEYTELTDSVDLAERLQVMILENISENYCKVKAAAKRLTYLQAQTEQQAHEIKEKMEANDIQMKRNCHEKREVLEKYECMEKMLETSRDSLAQMEALYKTTSAELTISKSQIQVNSSELVSVKRAYENSEADLKEMQTRYAADTDKLTEEKEQLKGQLEQMQETLGELRTDMTGVQTELSTKQNEVVDQKETITSLTSELEQAKEIIAVQQEQNQGLKNKNEVLLGSIEEKNDDISKLRQKLCDMESRLQTAEAQSESDLELMKQRCESLLTEQALTRQAHINQVRDLELELERRDCTGQLRTAHGLIQELQTELSEYTELAESLKIAEILQAKVQEVVNENFLKVKTAADKLLTMKRNIDKEKCEVADQKKVNEEEKVDLEGMKTALESSKNSLVQFETLYNSTSADLLSTSKQVQSLNEELNTTKTAYEACQLCKEDLINKLKESEEKERESCLERQGVQVSLEAKEQELENVNKRLTQVETHYKEKEQLLQCENDHLTSAVENLQRTLDSHDDDVDQAEKELYEIREYMTEKLETLDRLKIEAETRNMELHKYQQDNMKLRDNCAVMQSSIQELKETIQSNAYELSETKSHASRMLHEQGEELRECSQSASILTNKMDTLLQELHRKVGISTRQDAPSNVDHSSEIPVVEDSENVRKQRPCKARKSFLSEIFLAASRQQTAQASPFREEEESTDNVSDEVGEDSPQSDQNISGIYPLQSSTEASPATISRSKLGYSSSSAFAPVRTGQSLIVPQSGPLEIRNEKPGSPSDKVSDISAEQESNETQGEVCQGQLKEKETITQQINAIHEYFTEIIRLANIVEKALRLSIDEVNADNEELRQHIQKLQFVEQEAVRKDKEVVQQREAIATLEQRLENMAENLERFSDQESLIQTQKSELLELKSQLRTLVGEKQVLSNQVKEAVGRMKMLESSGDVEGSTASSVAEVFSLKMKIQKLRDQLLKKDEYYEELGNKASRRLKVYEENWRRAEAEVYRFDELMEIVGQTLSKRPDLVSQHQELKDLQKLIQGQKSLPSEKDSASVPLKSIKTAKW
ncbi:uncharacterized protein LOC132554347 [Ylistrum balloti]|uniref:uncharacterized protein LOC132554347 n=1 Tax=Ylistrum balloti TaxID=509963 RepID=UPI002905CF56|nr:uncharacterized protein LOC132554347 [Ylistrum balloti]